MRFKAIVVAVALLLAAGCTSQQPCDCPTPEPTEPSEPTEPTPTEPTEPTPVADTTDYITLERANWELSGAGDGLSKLLQTHWWAAVINPKKAALNCPDAFGDLFPYTTTQTFARAEMELTEHKEARALESRLDTVNRRCPTIPDFCGRSEVRKDVLADAKARIRLGIAWGGEFNSRIPLHTDPVCEPFGAYDNVAGWCSKCGKW